MNMREKMRRAYETAGSETYQGFWYKPFHVIRNIKKKPGEQEVWRSNEHDDHDTSYAAMMQKLDDLRWDAALEAMREPTDEMIANAWNGFDGTKRGFYDAMIDAAREGK